MEFYPDGTWNDFPDTYLEYSVVEFSGCINNSLVPTLVSGLASGSFFPVGTNLVTYSAISSNGSYTTCSFNVIVNDIEAPVPNIAVLPTITGECSATATAPHATDICTGNITGTTSDPLTYSSQGTFTIHWTYNDGHGNTSSQNQTVSVHNTMLVSISQGNLPGLCQGGAKVLTASSARATGFLWSNGATTAASNVYASGNLYSNRYQCYGMFGNGNRCSKL